VAEREGGTEEGREEGGRGVRGEKREIERERERECVCVWRGYSHT